ncbi:MAG: sterol desaturase family protein [Spirochaetaceae bacterium]|nr:sterol desaturase family protein [Spirochaetaceae bacterium]
MSNETKTSPPPIQLGLLGPLLLVVGLALAAYLGNEACSSSAGCVEGAREVWRATFPDWLRGAIRSIVHLVLSPWLWGLFVLVALAERLNPAQAGQKVLSKGFLHDAIAWWLADKLLFGLLVSSVLSYSAAIALYREYLDFLTVDWLVELPTGAKAAIAFVVSDFLNWLHHLVRHKVPAFWVFHAVHHSQREMNIFTDVRVHPFDRAIAMPIALIPMLALQLDVSIVPWLLTAQMLYTHAYHANVRTHYGPLKYLFVTPQSHRVHHSEAPEHADTNFGVIFCLWDRLFGTHVDQWDAYPQTGVQDPDFPMERRSTVGGVFGAYVHQFFYPFRQIWARLTTGRWQLPAG